MNDYRGSLTRRHLIRIGAASTVVLPAMLLSSPARAGVPLRKHIDALTADELANYKHALEILIKRGSTKPTAPDGYAWQAALHNDFERVRPDGSQGACEHRSELFLPWHRAHLAGFEFLLRAADPPRTANVTLPYWDWTKPASGVRFPAAFEDKSSPLFHKGRHHTVTPATPSIQWDAEAVKRMVWDEDWALFGGDPLNPDGSGGSFGSVEDGPHNTIHGDIGPTMGNPSTASRDPIYWSFHAYIDLIWARWQRLHTSAAKPQPFSTPKTKIWVEPFTPVVGEMAQTEKMPAGFSYGYDYDFTIDGKPIVVASAKVRDTRVLTEATTGGQVATTAPLQVQGARRRLLRLRDVVVLPDTSYSISAYVHPSSVNIQSVDAADRGRYLADKATVWMSGGHAHHPTNVNLDLTRAIDSFAGKDFVISVVTEGRPNAPTETAIPTLRLESDKVLASRRLWGTLVLEER